LSKAASQQPVSIAIIQVLVVAKFKNPQIFVYRLTRGSKNQSWWASRTSLRLGSRSERPQTPQTPSQVKTLS